MNLERLILLIYIVLPFLAAMPVPGVFNKKMLSPGMIASSLRILLLLVILRPIVFGGGTIGISTSLASGYPLEFVFSLDAFRFGFLITAEFCFLFAHWMGLVSGSLGVISMLLSLAQAFSSLFMISNNAVTTGGLLLLASAVFFYLIRFAISGQNREMGEKISRRMYSLYFLLGLLMIVWGIIEFGSKDMQFGPRSGSPFGLLFWLALMVLAVPIPPWSRWFTYAVECLPEGVTVTLVTFISGVALKISTLFSVVYPDMGWKQKLFLYLLGISGCAFSISGLFAAESRRKMLGSLPSFFFSLILVSVGVSKSSLVLSAYFSCLFVPVFTGLVLYASVMKVVSPLQKVFVGILFALILGVPGTPVFQIFSGIGARSLELGISYAIVFGLLWFFYFCANVHICRRIFVDERPPESGAPSSLEQAPISFAGYGVFLMCFIIVATQLAGGIL
ncbi:MAG: hypothetical protein ACXWQO_16355 [Bdellovibrionota bacterium]